MATDQLLKAQLPNVLTSTDFPFLGEKYEGKVRDCYTTGDIRYLITSDRLSCFDVILTSIPFKGQLLNQITVDWFGKVGDIIENHIIDIPHPNVIVGKNAEVVPIEVVVRGYLTGSAWRDYDAGKPISGIRLPDGMRNSQKFEENLITPSTKAEVGEHDEPISEEEIIEKQVVPTKLWEEIREAALALFARGQEIAEKRGLILVDTKYEFGLVGEKLILVDEIHTLDSSRYWIKDDYQSAFESGRTPKMLDKEPVRQWLLEQGFSGTGEPPKFTDEKRIEIAHHYVDSYTLITGEDFQGEAHDTQSRIKSVLKEYVGQK